MAVAARAAEFDSLVKNIKREHSDNADEYIGMARQVMSIQDSLEQARRSGLISWQEISQICKELSEQVKRVDVWLRTNLDPENREHNAQAHEIGLQRALLAYDTKAEFDDWLKLPESAAEVSGFMAGIRLIQTHMNCPDIQVSKATRQTFALLKKCFEVVPAVPSAARG